MRSIDASLRPLLPGYHPYQVGLSIDAISLLPTAPGDAPPTPAPVGSPARPRPASPVAAAAAAAAAPAAAALPPSVLSAASVAAGDADADAPPATPGSRPASPPAAESDLLQKTVRTALYSLPLLTHYLYSLTTFTHCGPTHHGCTHLTTEEDGYSHSPAEDGTRQYCLERQSTHYDSTCYGHDHICLLPGTHRGPGGAHVPPRSVGDAEGRLRRDGGPQGELKLWPKP